MFSHLQLAPPDPILNTALQFKQDTNPKKVNLGIGAYRTNQGKPYVLPVVRRAEEELVWELGRFEHDKEYLPIDGLPGLKQCTQELIFGRDMVEGEKAILKGRIASAQSLSGTGSLRIVAEFIQKHKIGGGGSSPVLYYSDPTWGNHPTIFKSGGFADAQPYPYWDPAKKSIKYQEMLGHFQNSPNKSVYLIHPCAHNPTGLDPSIDQFKEIIRVCIMKQHIVILDSAYQGYASGSLEKDREVIRMFAEAVKPDGSGLQGLFLCQSFAKNLGLYGERIGMVHVVTRSQDEAEKVLSQIKLIIRPMYSSPPLHGAALVSKILGSEELYKQWTVELKEMAERILYVRSRLRTGLEKKGTPGSWTHITDQIGMFSFTGLSPSQCERLISEYSIYLLKSGRISLAGLNTYNLEYVINAIDSVVRG